REAAGPSDQGGDVIDVDPLGEQAGSGHQVPARAEVRVAGARVQVARRGRRCKAGEVRDRDVVRAVWYAAGREVRGPVRALSGHVANLAAAQCVRPDQDLGLVAVAIAVQVVRAAGLRAGGERHRRLDAYGLAAAVPVIDQAVAVVVDAVGADLHRLSQR